MKSKEQPEFPTWIQFGLQFLIVYAILTMCLETMPELSAYRDFFFISELVVVVIFTVEYMIRWVRSDDRRNYPFTFFAGVDLVAVLPFYLSLGIDLRGLRALRILRMARILKLGRYSRAMQVLGDAFRRTGPELAMFGSIAGVIVLLSAMGLYYAEHDAQPEVYSSIPATLWWAVVTLTTVGYGDVYPTTVIGKIIASAVMFTGIGMIAVPTGLLSGAMTDIIRNRQEEED